MPSFTWRARHFWDRWLLPVVPVPQMLRSVRLYRRYQSDLLKYKALSGAEPVLFANSYPCLFDASETTPYDSHYFYQAHWATERIIRQRPKGHIDVGSEAQFVGLLTTHIPVTFIDIRPLKASLPGLAGVAGSVVELPIHSGKVDSISCLHVVEHVGLGRYGDSLDPFGTKRGCAELQRVLAPGGNLFLSLPIGNPRVCFNAHRIHSARQILSLFEKLTLREFSAVDDANNYCVNANVDDFETASYSCGMFWFERQN